MASMRKLLNWQWSERSFRCPVSAEIRILLLCLLLFSAPYPAARAAVLDAGVSVADLNAMEELVINRKGLPSLFIGDVVRITPDSGQFVLVPAEEIGNCLQAGTSLFQVFEKTPAYLAMSRISPSGTAAASPAADTLIDSELIRTDYLADFEFSIPRGEDSFSLGDVIFYDEGRLCYLAVPVSYLLGELKEKTPLFLITEVAPESYLIKPVNAGEDEDPVLTAGLMAEGDETF